MKHNKPTPAQPVDCRALFAFFPGAFAVELRWTVNLPDPMPDGHEQKLFLISGVQSVSSGTSASGPQVECCLPLAEATPARINQLATQIGEANAERSDGGRETV